MIELRTLGYYEYNYSPGSSPDRRIGFYEKGERLIEVHVEAKSEGKWREISVLQEGDILVQAESTTEKMNRFLESRELGTSFQAKPDIKFSDPILSLENKKKLISQLEPNGNFRIEIRNDIGDDPRFEVVRTIGFFNPT